LASYLGGGFLEPSKDETLEMLPKLMCWISDGMKQEIPKGTYYVNRRAISGKKPTVSVYAILNKGAIGYTEFVDFYKTKLLASGVWFRSELNFFGKREVYRTRIVKEVSHSVMPGGTDRVQFLIEIDSFYNYFVDPSATYVLFCDGSVNCFDKLSC
jgi:hypothetical protein